jgi:hypothetical protein
VKGSTHCLSWASYKTHILAVCSKCRDCVNIIAHGVCSNHCLIGMKGSCTHHIAETLWKNLCTVCWNCKYIKVWQEWEERLILIWHLFKWPFLWFFLLNWTWCSFFADTKLISLRRFRRYVSLCSFVWRNALPYFVSKMQRLQFSVDSELMTLYDTFPRRFIAVHSVTLNHLVAYSESCFVCWCS